ncbi:TPA: hypothetical protein ACH3X2_003625 [Trebouxia sp. C0005]
MQARSDFLSVQVPQFIDAIACLATEIAEEECQLDPQLHDSSQVSTWQRAQAEARSVPHFATAIMPRPKGKGGKPVKAGKTRDVAADRGRSNLREAWAGGNYTRSSVSPEGSDSSDVQNSIPFRLAMWDLGQCDKKRCTGTKLVRQQVVSELRLGTPFPGVILSPNGKCCVSNEDKELIGVKGLAVVDCSWNKLDEVPFGTPLEDSFCLPLH